MSPGDLVAGRFELEARAGQGAMGVLFRARDRASGAPVAIKVLHPQAAHFAARMAREARALATLAHPAVVRYVAHGRLPDGRLFLAMEWLDGEDLAQTLRRGPLAPAAAVALAARVADALAVAHARGFVHRDVKPANLFLPGADPGAVKVLDFGIARLTDADAATRDGVVVGTLAYMSPEQARGRRDLDGRSDLFSLGCVVFECLAGRPAVTGRDRLAVLSRIVLEDPPPLSELRPGLDPALVALVVALLAKDPARRPRDAATVAAAFTALAPAVVVEGAAVPARPAPVAAPSAPVALTSAEQRVLCILLTGDARHAVALPDSEPGPDPGRARVPLAAVADLVARHRGRLDALASGALLVTHDLEGAATDQAAQAARCALALRALLPGVDICLAAGRCTLPGSIPVGDVIDRAALLLDPTRRGSGDAALRVDAATAALLERDFVLEGDGSVRVLRPSPGAASGVRTLLGRPTPFVGREDELATLEGLWERTRREGGARAALVLAPAGAGKSRLRHELLRRAGPATRTWLCRGDPLLARSPYGTFAEALREHAGIQQGAPPAVQRAQLRACLASALPEPALTRVAAFLGEASGVPFPDDDDLPLRTARRDPVVMADQLRAAWEELFRAQTARGPLLLVVEDLHHADPPSARLVDLLLRSLHDRRLLVLALARPELDATYPGLWSGRALHRIELPGIAPGAARALVHAALGDGAPEAGVQALVDRAGGNAFFLEELVRAVAQGRGVHELPDTVLAMVQSRLGALEPEARRLLRAASVYGRTFWPGAVAALLGPATDPRALGPALERLEARELVVRAGAGRRADEPEYRFRHVLLQQAAYAALTDEDRRLGHRLAAAWLARDGDVDPALLADHYELGGDAARAADCHLDAAARALDADDFAAVIARGDRALACGAAGERAGRARALQAEAHRWRGEFAVAEDRAGEAMALLPPGSVGWLSAAGASVVAGQHVGGSERLAALVARLRAVVPDPAATRAYALVLARAGTQCFVAGLNELGDALLEAIEAYLVAHGSDDPLVIATASMARGSQALAAGDPAGYLARTRKGAEAFERAGDLRRAANARVCSAHACLELGAWREAEEGLDAALLVAARLGLAVVEGVARHNLGIALARQGAVAQGCALERASVELFRALGDARMEGASRMYLATILALAGEPGSAEREAEEAVRLLEKSPTVRAHALATLARLRLAAGRAGDALGPAREAREILATLGSLEEGEGEVRLAWVEALAATGRAGEARDELAAARARLEARAACILDPARRRSFLTEVPEHARTLALAARGEDVGPLRSR